MTRLLEEYSPYPKYKECSIHGLSVIPSDWNELPLFSICKIQSVVNQTDKELLSVYLRQGVIKFSDVKEKRTNVTSLDLSKYQLVKVGNFVLNNQQAWRGSVGVSVHEGIVSPAYLVLELSKVVDPLFANYLFRDSVMVGQYLASSKGVGTIQRNLYWPQLKRKRAALPPVEDQKAISHFLDDKTEKIERAIAIKEKQIEFLRERKQILIQNAVTRGLNLDVKMKDSGVDWIGEIPAHWTVKKLKHVSDAISEKVPSASSNLSYIGMENIASFSGKYVKSDSEVDGLANAFEVNDVLFGKLRPYLAKVFLAETRGICSTEFLILRTGKVNVYFLSCLLRSKRFIELVNSSTYGSKMPRANSNFIRGQFVPVPPKTEQEDISKSLLLIQETASNLIDITNQQIQHLKEYKASLINSAVTGKIKVPA